MEIVSKSNYKVLNEQADSANPSRIGRLLGWKVKPLSSEDGPDAIRNAMDRYDRDKDEYRRKWNEADRAFDLGYTGRYPKALDSRDYGLPKGYRRGNRKKYEKKFGLI